MNMSKLSYTILSGMPSVLDFTSDKVRAAGWYGHTKGLHTISISVHNFQGRITIEGSQIVNPTCVDWFPVPYPEPFTGLPYMQYPRINIPQRNPNGKGETSTFGFSFRTNCLWLRASINRQYLLPIAFPNYAKSMTDNISWLGAVDSILVNY